MKITYDTEVIDSIKVGDFLTLGTTLFRIVALKDVTSKPAFFVTIMNVESGLMTNKQFDSVGHLISFYKPKHTIKHTKCEDVELIIRNGVDIR